MIPELHRPRAHYAPGSNWLNDPNGLIWYDGEYHLFYQYNPLGTGWGNMSWGHAVSPDLVHWTELPVALAHTDDEHVFSGSVVLDRDNTAGFASGGVPALVAIYTAVDPHTGRQAQALAHSADKGRTWTRYGGNPVLDIGSTDFRDPKVFWHEPSGCWVMVIVLAADRVVRFYRSDDLKSWMHLSDFGAPESGRGPWECPDLFELPVDGDPERTRWVLVVSVGPGEPDGWTGTHYFVGDFDGSGFTPDDPDADGLALDFGADYYAAVSFADAPHGERVLVGWMSSWTYAADTPASAFRGSMSIPRVHRLATIDGAVRLLQEAVPALARLRGSSYSFGGFSVDDVVALPTDAGGDVLEIHAVLEPGSSKRCGLHVRVGAEERTVVGYCAPSGLLYVDRTESGNVDFHPDFPAAHPAPLPLDDGRVAITVLVDTASVEVFGGRGEAAITNQIFPSASSTGLAVFADGGTARVVELSVTQLLGAPDGHESAADVASVT